MTFDEAREAKWRAGRAERGLSPDDPFEGDWAKEICDEFVDVPNYADVGVQRGELSHEEWNRLYLLSRECWMMMQRVMEDRNA